MQVDKHDNDSCLIIRFDGLPPGFKTFVRENLASICEGSANSKKSPRAFSYKNTVRRFFERYDNKEYELKVGMIGELLAHIVLSRYDKRFIPLSILFNTEEISAKKGFDIIYSDKKKNLWIAEVKSSKKDRGELAGAKHKAQVGKAKSDLKKRIPENKSAKWSSALQGLNHIDSKGKIKNEVKKVLEDGFNKSLTGTPDIGDYNVILISALDSLRTSCDINAITNYYDKHIKGKDFKKIIVFAIQKKTFKKIEDFLRGEI